MPCVSVKHIWSSRASYKTYKLSKKSFRNASKTSRAASTRASASNPQSAHLAKPADLRSAKITETSIKIPHTPKASYQTTFFSNETLRPKSKKSSRTPKHHVSHIPAPAVLEPIEPYVMRDPADVVRAFHASKHLTRADLINAESCLGSILFGPVPAGHRREFFHDRENVWIWHESWYDQNVHHRQQTVRYEVRTSGVYKKISAGNYLKLDGIELENFRNATHAYLKIIKTYLYNHPKAQI